jgi:hypothetical protein
MQGEMERESGGGERTEISKLNVLKSERTSDKPHN